MTEKIAIYQNVAIHYKTAGHGQPVMLVHGFAEDSDVWKYQQQELANHYHLVMPDLPGSGLSGIIRDMSVEGMADCIKHIAEQELSKTDAEEIVMIGHSMGGYITLAFAEKYPAMLSGFGLFHSTAFTDSDEKKAARRRGIAFIQKHGSAAFISQLAPNLFTDGFRIKNNTVLAEMIARSGSFDPLALAKYYEAMIERPNRNTVLQSFTKPVLFIIGKNDKAIPFEDSMKQCHLPQMASIEIFEQSAHMGMWEEKEKSRLVLLSFLQDASVY